MALVGAVNAVQVIRRLGHDIRPSTRLLIHAYDFGFFLFLGLALTLVSVVANTFNRKWHHFSGTVWATGAVSVVGAAIGAFALPRDLMNFIDRVRLPVSASVLGAVVGAFAFGSWIVFRFQFRRLLQSAWARGVLLAAGGLFAYLNAELLSGNYAGVHFFVSIFAIIAIAEAGSLFRVSQRSERYLWAGLLTASILTVFVSPRAGVRSGLTVSSGSSVYPIVCEWMPKAWSSSSKNESTDRSTWFHDRSHLPAIESSHSTLLSQRPIVLYVSIDALRSDVIANHELATKLPTFARIRDNSLWFRVARTPAPGTVVALTSLFTGKYYSQIHFSSRGSAKPMPLEDKSIRLPELLEFHGVATTHVVAYRSIAADRGVSRGFGKEIRTRGNFGNASEVTDRIIEEIERKQNTKNPSQLIFAHFVDSHEPYDRAGKEGTPYERYLGELGIIDAELERLLEYIESNGLKERVFLIVAADHGEAFGEHGKIYHATSVYEELLRVPLMVYAKSIRPGINSQPVSLIDLGPTILDLFGIETPGSFMGQSLVPILEGKPLKFARPIVADAGRRMQAFMFDDGIKVIFDLPKHTVEVYDLNADPKEERNLIDHPTRDVSHYVTTAEQFFSVHVLKIPGWSPPWRDT